MAVKAEVFVRIDAKPSCKVNMIFIFTSLAVINSIRIIPVKGEWMSAWESEGVSGEGAVVDRWVFQANKNGIEF